MDYTVNKGIGKPAEFQGLKSQYLFIFAGGLLGVFVVFVVMYMAGINQWVCIIFGVIAALSLVYGIFYLNGKYGEHGLMKVQARRNHPRYIINRRRFSRLFHSIQGAKDFAVIRSIIDTTIKNSQNVSQALWLIPKVRVE